MDYTNSDQESSKKIITGKSTKGDGSLKTPILDADAGAGPVKKDDNNADITKMNFSKISLRELLSSKKNRSVVAVTAAMTLAVIVMILVVTSPRFGRKFDQYTTNHGVNINNANARSNLYCNRNDAFYNTTSDDGLSGCSGTCYSQYRNILVPSEGYSNGCSTCYCDPSTYSFRCTKASSNCTKSKCQYNGWYYEAGEDVPYASGDSCNTCTCKKYYNETKAAMIESMNSNNYDYSQEYDGNGTYMYTYYETYTYDENDAYDYEVECTTNSNCNTCIYEGATYSIGTSFIGNGCPNSVCTCTNGGNVTCVDMDNGEENGDSHDGGGGGSHDARCEGYCTWEGYAYQTYSCFKSVNGRNMCTCMDDGSVVCTDCDNLQY